LWQLIIDYSNHLDPSAVWPYGVENGSWVIDYNDTELLLAADNAEIANCTNCYLARQASDLHTTSADAYVGDWGLGFYKLNKMNKRGLDNLKIYKLAEELEILVYKITKNFPEDERYRSVDQLRRSSSSVADNIAEGYGRHSFQDKISKFYIARGETEETRKGIEKSFKKEFITEKTMRFFNEKYTQLAKQINAYINFLRNQQEKYSQSPSSHVPKHPSFTLIELMVSMSLLVVAILATLGIYLRIIGSQEKTLGQLNIQEDGQYLMSLIVKDIRAGIIDYNNYPNPLDSPEDELLLLDYSGNQIRYKTDLTGSGNCASTRSNFQTITMTNVSVERLDFYISPLSDPFTAGSITYEHPRITVVLKLKSLIEKTGERELVLQQTVPQRHTERK